MDAVIQEKRFRLKLGDLSFRQDPSGEFSRILERGPVFRGKMPLMGNVWFSTSWESVKQVLRNTDDFVREPTNAGRKTYSWIQWLMPSVFNRLSQNMLNKDGQDHRRLRLLVDQAFQRQSIKNLENRIEQIVDEHLNQIEQRFRAGESSIDFMPGYCRSVPLAVICEMLGLPESDRARFSRWFSGMSNIKSFVDIFRMVPMMRRTMKYLEAQFEEVRLHPRSGLITALVQAETDGDRLSKDELLSTVMILLLAGHETTVHLISNSIVTLLQFDQAKSDLLSDWSLADGAIDEVLRWCSTVHIAKPRFVAHDMDFFGQSLKRGDRIVPIVGCANFDPTEFENPAEFQIRRSPNRHMTFGNGPHVCIGMVLAKAETRIALRQLFTRWPDLRPAFDPGRPDWGKRIGMRTLNSLNLTIKQ